jgi:hypothetical protein
MCAAPIGNEFWKLRSSHGRDKLFATPDLLLEAAYEYFQWCNDNPLIEVDFKGKDASKVDIPKMRAFTMQGLCRYLNCNTAYFRNFKMSACEDFNTVITRIEEIIYEHKFTGAAAGFLNPNIIARDLGLTDKKDLVINNDITVEYIDETHEAED